MERYPHHAPSYPLALKHLLLHPTHWCPEQKFFYREHSHSYAEFIARVGKIANALRTLGVKPGDAVGVMDWDSHRYLEFFFAVPMCGAMLHTVNIRRRASRPRCNAGYPSA
ncbi:AMP-binding protein [Oleiharenicola lentus]|uniref:AMP-binding protein n=1 Tax=Oleiharenicola lentus TaxID=2508720 RepID=UPI003F67E62A